MTHNRKDVGISVAQEITRGHRYITLALIIACLIALRLVHLGADSPVMMPTLPADVGLYVDEGYKTLSPRNLILFGSEHWNPADTYRGWFSASPLTQWVIYAAFAVAGPTIEAARAVTVFYFALLLAGYAWGMAGRLRWPVFLSGLAALGVETTLFFYSRVALFEVPLTAFIYGVLFYFARMDPARTVRPILLTSAVGAFLAVSIKMSALFYLAPIGLAAVVYLLVQNLGRARLRQRHLVVLFAMVAALIVAVSMYGPSLVSLAERNIAMSTKEFGGFGAVFRTLTMPLLRGAPIVVVAGLLCIAHGVITQPAQWLGNLYRLSLIFLVLLTPAVLSLFPYSPLRYYVPLLPAYILLVLEWWQLRSWRAEPPWPVTPWLAPIGIALLALVAYSGVFGVYELVRHVMPLVTDVERTTVVKYLLLPIAVTLAVFGWQRRSALLRPRPLITAMLVLLGAFVLHTLYGLTSFLAAPTYQLRAAREGIVRVLPQDATIAGDWAPVLALNTPLRALYMTSRWNPVEDLAKTRPSHFLYSNSQESNRVLKALGRASGVRLGEPVYSTYYFGRRRVVLYSLYYEDTVNIHAPTPAADHGRAKPEAGSPRKAPGS